MNSRNCSHAVHFGRDLSVPLYVSLRQTRRLLRGIPCFTSSSLGLERASGFHRRDTTAEYAAHVHITVELAIGSCDGTTKEGLKHTERKLYTDLGLRTCGLVEDYVLVLQIISSPINEQASN